MSVAAPADKRFRRSRVRPGRKRVLDPRVRARSIAVTVAVCAGVALAYGAARAVLASEALTITTIAVEGAVRMPEGIVADELNDLLGRPMFGVRLEPWRGRLEALTWVASASMRRVIPGTVVVTITERQPVAIGRDGDTLSVIDQRGVILDAFGPNYRDLDLPIVDGLAFGDARDVSPREQARAALAIRLLTELRGAPELASAISQIDVTNARNAVVILKGDTVSLHLGEAEFAERLQGYLDLKPALRDGMPNVETVDLRFGSRVFVRPRVVSAVRAKGMGSRE